MSCKQSYHKVVQAFWIPNLNTGDFIYRVQLPGKALSMDENVRHCALFGGHPQFPHLAEEADLLILHLAYEPALKHIVTYRRARGKATILEIPDNLIALHPWLGAQMLIRDPYYRSHAFLIATLCDGLQLSTPELAKTMGFLNENYRTFPNQIDHFVAPRPLQDRIKIGWGGSAGHRQDILSVKPTIAGLLEDFPQVDFGFMGVPEIFELFAQGLPSERLFFRPYGSIESYYSFLSMLDIGIIPLSPSEFNRCRTDVKYVEYAACGLVPVIQDAAPYRHHFHSPHRAVSFTDFDELRAVISELIKAPQKMAHIQQAAFSYACQFRGLKQDYRRRMQWYRQVLPPCPGSDVCPQYPEQNLELVANYAELFKWLKSGHYDQTVSAANKMLADYPDFQQVHVIRAQALRSLGQFAQLLDVYGNFAPHHFFNDTFFWEMSLAALAFEPECADLFINRIGDEMMRLKLQARNDPDLLNENQCRRILSQNPFDYDVLLRMVRLLAETPEREDESKFYLSKVIFMHPETGSQLERQGFLPPRCAWGNPFTPPPAGYSPFQTTVGGI